MDSTSTPVIDVDEWDDLYEHGSFLDSFDFRNESRFNGDYKRYKALLDDLANAEEWRRWYRHPEIAERETVAYYPERTEPYLYIYELDPFGGMPVVKVHAIDAAYARALIARFAPSSLAHFKFLVPKLDEPTPAE